MNELKVFTIPESDWEALYVNNNLVCEGHAIRLEDLLEFFPAISLDILHISNYDSDEDYFPENIEDFPSDWRINSGID